MDSQLPEELILSLKSTLPCRERQIRQLTSILGVRQLKINLKWHGPLTNSSQSTVPPTL